MKYDWIVIGKCWTLRRKWKMKAKNNTRLLINCLCSLVTTLHIWLALSGSLMNCLKRFFAFVGYCFVRISILIVIWSYIMHSFKFSKSQIYILKCRPSPPKPSPSRLGKLFVHSWSFSTPWILLTSYVIFSFWRGHATHNRLYLHTKSSKSAWKGYSVYECPLLGRVGSRQRTPYKVTSDGSFRYVADYSSLSSWNVFPDLVWKVLIELNCFCRSCVSNSNTRRAQEAKSRRK